jgi:hypothetical protein
MRPISTRISVFRVLKRSLPNNSAVLQQSPSRSRLLGVGPERENW